MHPALSIIFFTTASGSGFALLMLVGIGVPLGLLPDDAGFGFVALAVALVFGGGGLAASALHLGRPERAWRAFSQWRSSWLSREGVLSLLTGFAAAVFGIGWVFFGATQGVVGLYGILAAALAVATIYCTGMIYASLKPIHQWHNRWVVPNYLALGLLGGCVLLDFLIRFWVPHPSRLALGTIVVALAAWWIKEAYWRLIDTNSAPSTVASATGLGSRGVVRMLEPPHTEENYLLKEMGYRVARKHARQLRRIARLGAFALPAGATFAAFLRDGAWGEALAALAVASAALGLVAERWLFFAEAKHTVTLYYGAAAV